MKAENNTASRPMHTVQCMHAGMQQRFHRIVNCLVCHEMLTTVPCQLAYTVVLYFILRLAQSSFFCLFFFFSFADFAMNLHER